ncbi:hypothetical protein DXG01_009188 [Tephrocybe rancida]|nr:hypothetical protein DXG01_009188 [Tephrocybe rancida]
MDSHELPALGGDFELLNFDLYVPTLSLYPTASLTSLFLVNSGSFSSDDLSPLLATPVGPAPAHDTAWIESPYVTPPARFTLSSSFSLYSGYTRYTVESVVGAPGAPILKDLDSFTDGTGAGSFADFVDEDEDFTHGILVSHPEPYNASIQAWRMDVSASNPNAPLVPFADLPDDPLQTEALESAEALLGGFAFDAETNELEDVDEHSDVDVGGGVELRTPTPCNLVPPISAPIMMTPRVTKRARPRSTASQSPRRVRSRSLSSIRGLPSDLTAQPPWRLTHPFKD